MKLDRKSKTIRWAYPFQDSYSIPAQTSLCAIFWRSVLLTPMKLFGSLIILCAVCATIVNIGIGAIHHPRIVLITLSLSMGLAGAGYQLDKRRKSGKRVADWPLVQGAVAVKKKFCPIVEIEGGRGW